jgi:hypothetical protein
VVAGIIFGLIIWAICFIPFLMYPSPSSFFLALFVAPLFGGYFGARRGGNRAAYIITIIVFIAVSVLSGVYIPNTSWDYAHHLWAGVAFLITLLILCNIIFVVSGGLLGIQIKSRGRHKQEDTKPEEEIKKPEKDELLQGTLPKMPNPLQAKITELEMKEKDLRHDLAVIKNKKGLEQVSPELLGEREKGLEKQLLDVILEKERLIRKSEGKLVEN